MPRTLTWLFVAFFAHLPPLLAHPAPFSYVDVRLEPKAVETTVVVHVYDAAHDLGLRDMEALLDPAALARHAAGLTALVTGRLAVAVDGRALEGGRWSAPEPLPDRHAVRLRVRHDLPSTPGAVAVRARMFPYDPVHQTFVNVYEGGAVRLQGILGKDREEIEHFSGTRQGRAAVVRRFAASGVHHILIGPDHLLFLVGLLLLGGSLAQLVLLVSAFTLAHSITLTLAALDVVNPPPSVVEPAIALSIVYVGADNLTVRQGRDVRAWIAFAFGLVHGFGFAGVLRQMELPPDALGWALFSFNLGVEAGQLLVVAVTASALRAVRARSETAGRRVAFAGSVIVMLAGAFWFIERVF